MPLDKVQHVRDDVNASSLRFGGGGHARPPVTMVPPPGVEYLPLTAACPLRRHTTRTLGRPPPIVADPAFITTRPTKHAHISAGCGGPNRHLSPARPRPAAIEITAHRSLRESGERTAAVRVSHDEGEPPKENHRRSAVLPAANASAAALDACVASRGRLLPQRRGQRRSACRCPRAARGASFGAFDHANDRRKERRDQCTRTIAAIATKAEVPLLERDARPTAASVRGQPLERGLSPTASRLALSRRGQFASGETNHDGGRAKRCTVDRGPNKHRG